MFQVAGWLAAGGLGAGGVLPVALWRWAKADARRSNREADKWRAGIRARAAAPGYSPYVPA